MQVKRSWETLSNVSAMAAQVVTLVKYSNAMRSIHNGSGIESHLPSESLCIFLCGLPVARISCYQCDIISVIVRDHDAGVRPRGGPRQDLGRDVPACTMAAREFFLRCRGQVGTMYALTAGYGPPTA